jgi:tetratricopeptide (TPR) repeat protein
MTAHAHATPPPITVESGDTTSSPAVETPRGAEIGVNAHAEFIRKAEDGLKSARSGGNKAGMPRKLQKLLGGAISHYRQGEYGASAKLALEATQFRPDCAQAFHTLALALEGMGQLHKALVTYEHALKLDPSDSDIYINLGLAAWKLNMLEAAEKFFTLAIEVNPDSHAGYNNLAGVRRDQGRYDEAIDILQGAIYRLPHCPQLWNSLGTVLTEQQRPEEAITFYAEALRLDPGFARAQHNIGYALSHMDRVEESLEAFEASLEKLELRKDRIEARHSRAYCLLQLGRLREGWDEWEARLDHEYRHATLFALDMPRWHGEDVAGKNVLAIAEQGLGDEIMLANALPELADAIGPVGQLFIACERRLISLFERAFPGAIVGPAFTKSFQGRKWQLAPWVKEHSIDFYTPFGSTMRQFRPSVESFDASRFCLTPDPARVAHWRERLAALGPGPYVGLCWKSLLMNAWRSKYFSPLDHWQHVLGVEGLTFINMQYGDCADDLAQMKERFGKAPAVFDDLDLKNDLENVAALSAAIDLMIAPATAASNITGAVGTQTWLVIPGRAWTLLGTDHFPWYSSTRVFRPDAYGDWAQVFTRIGESLAAYAAAGGKAG